MEIEWETERTEYFDRTAKTKELESRYDGWILTSDLPILDGYNQIDVLVLMMYDSQQLEQIWDEQPLHVQIKYLPRISYFYPDTLIAFLTLMSWTNYPTVHLPKSFEESDEIDFYKTISDAGVNNLCNEPKSLNFEQEFIRVYWGFTDSSLAVAERILINFMQILYGEKVMFECVNRLKEENIDCGYVHLIHLLREWDEVKKYPLEWSIHTQS